MDFKKITLQLYDQQVCIILKLGTDSYLSYGEKVEGTLSTRIWGEWYDKEDCISTVTAVMVKTEVGLLQISCTDISSIERVESLIKHPEN